MGKERKQQHFVPMQLQMPTPSQVMILLDYTLLMLVMHYGSLHSKDLITNLWVSVIQQLQVQVLIRMMIQYLNNFLQQLFKTRISAYYSENSFKILQILSIQEFTRGHCKPIF